MKKKYDLVHRVELFGKSIIEFSKKIPRNSINFPLISQLVRAGTSVGANYCEADNAESRRDYVHKVGIAKKEAKESIYWLKMVAVSEPELCKEAKRISDEAGELNLIMNAIINKVKAQKEV